MKKLHIISIFLLGFCAELSAQNFSNYTVQNAHSHNDYHQKNPFWEAYNTGFGSIEADVFLRDGKLLVAHSADEISEDRTLERLYLSPVSAQIKNNEGFIYPNSRRRLILLIEMKSDYQTELPVLSRVLQAKYRDIITNKGVKIIITGHIPEPSEFKNYPKFLFFDGDFTKKYSAEELRRVGFFSSDLSIFTNWNGEGDIPINDLEKLKSAVAKGHSSHKKVRFWGAPDFPNAWRNLMMAGADIINTDHIKDLADFFNNLKK